MKRIVCFHLYNDYSGSPKVLHMVLGGLIEKGCRIDLISSDGGVLNELDGSPAFRRYSVAGRSGAGRPDHGETGGLSLS